MCEAVKEGLYVKEIINFITKRNYRIDVKCDNQATIASFKNKETTKKAKHIDIKFCYLKQKLQEEIGLTYIKSEENPADVMTKIPQKVLYVKHLKKIIGA